MSRTHISWILLLVLAACSEPPSTDFVSEAARYRDARPVDTRRPEPPPPPPEAPPEEPPRIPDPPRDPPPIIIPSTPLEPGHPVGTIDDHLDVSATGAANYRIPVEVPPGFRGMEPRIALQYSSDRRIGEAGPGMALEGLSRIERCEGEVNGAVIEPRAVDFTERDALCLDGMRLVAVAGAHGGDGTTYMTEGQTWTRIIGHGGCSETVAAPTNQPTANVEASGNCFFEATLRNGNVVRFGEEVSPACASVSGQANAETARFSWPVTSITDSSGNRLSVSWTEGGERWCVPESISYGENTTLSRAADRKVAFTYEQDSTAVLPGETQQADITVGQALTTYIGGLRRTQNARLRRIETQLVQGTSVTVVKQLRLSYEVSPWSYRQRLKSVQECGANDVCLPETVLSWSDTTWLTDVQAYDPDFIPNTASAPSVSAEHSYTGDFNGDGRLDFIQWKNSDATSARQYLAHQPLLFELSVFPVAPQFDLPLKNWGIAHTGDFDGDGYTDFLVLRADPAGYELYRGGPNGLNATPAFVKTHSDVRYNRDFVVGDFDRDGRSELFRAHDWDNTWRVYTLGSNGFVQTSQGSFPSVGCFPDFDDLEGSQNLDKRLIPGDFDGDGRIDILVHRRIFMNPLPNYYGVYPPPELPTFFPSEPWEEDRARGHAWILLRSNGSGFSQSGHGIWPQDKLRVSAGDFDGDGRTDVLLRGIMGSLTALSTGRGFVYDFDTPSAQLPKHSDTLAAPLLWEMPQSIRYADAVFVGELNGDGRADLITAYSYDDDVSSVLNPQWSGVRLHTFVPRVNGSGVGDFVLRATPQTDSPMLAADLTGSGELTVLTHPYLAGNPQIAFHTPNLSDLSVADRLVEVTNGLKAKTTLDYEPMNLAGIHLPGTPVQAPLRTTAGPRLVVEKVTRHDPRSQQSYTDSYRYIGGVSDLNGRGFQGFEEVRISDGVTVEARGYHTAFPRTGLLRHRVTELLAYSSLLYGEPIRRSDFEYADAASYGGLSIDVQLRRESITDFHLNNGVSNPGTQSSVLYRYDSYGNVTLESRDPDVATTGNELQIATTFDNSTVGTWSLGQPKTRITTGQGILQEEKFEYDTWGNLSRHAKKDSYHNVWLGVQKGFDELGNVVVTTDPDGNQSHYDYEPTFRTLERIENALGHVSLKTIDPGFGVETERVDENGVVTTFVLDAFGRVTSVIGPDEQGVPIEIERHRFIEWPAGDNEEFGGYVAQTQKRETWDGSLWRTEEVFKDSFERSRVRRRFMVDGTQPSIPVSSQIDLHYHDTHADLLVAESRSYRPQITPVEVPHFTHYVHDHRRRPLFVHLPNGEANVFAYDDVQRILRKWEPGNAYTELTMDGAGNVVRKQAANGGITHYSFDALDRLAWVQDPGGVTTTVHYDSMGRRDWVSRSDTGTTFFVYGPTGHLIGETDPMGNHLTRSFDALDRTLRRTLYEGTTPVEYFDFTYDNPTASHGIGNLTRVEKWAGGTNTQRHEFGYDAYGRQASTRVMLHGHSFAFTHRYAPSGEALSMTYPDGSELDLRYTGGGLLNDIRLREPNEMQSNSIVRYEAYDAEGRPVYSQHGRVGACHEYDQKTGQVLTSRAHRYAGLADNPCVQPSNEPLMDKAYTWDAVGRVEAITDLDPTLNQTFAYDIAGNLTQATGAYGIESYVYDAAGNRTFANGVAHYHNGHQLTGNAQGLSATYDNNGNMLTKVDPSNGRNLNFRWNVEDQLKDVTVNGKTTEYDYDFSGHRVMKRDSSNNVTLYASRLYELQMTPSGSITRTRYLPGPMGHVAQKTDHGTSIYAAMTEHQVLAQMFADGNSWGQMRSFGHQISALAVDPVFAGRATKVAKAVVPVTAGLLLLWTVGFLVRRRERYWVRPLLASATAAAFWVTYGSGLAEAAMSPGSQGSGVPEPGLVYFLQDHVGSTSLAFDDNGVVTGRVDYEPFGRVAGSSSGTDNFRAKFGGHELDTEPGLYFANHRYYDPDLGRFVSADTSIGSEPLRSVTLNRYAYGNNNPVSYRDPSGRFAIFAFLGFVIGGAIAGALIAGTGGKILTDPANAFDDWSWGRAFGGFFLGAALGAVSFAISTIGASVTVAGFSVKSVLQTTFSTAVIRASMAYANGGDLGDVFAAFGVGAFTGFLTGTGFLGVADLGGGGQLLAQQLTTLSDSALKAATGQEASVTLSLWAFSLTVDHRGKLNFGPNYGFLVAEATRAGLAIANGRAPDLALGNLSVRNNLPDPQPHGLFGLGQRLATAFENGGSELFRTAAELTRTVIDYGAGQLQRAGPINQLGLLGDALVGTGQNLAHEGVTKAHCSVDPQASGC